MFHIVLNPLTANPTKWSNTLNHFVNLAFKGLIRICWLNPKKNFTSRAKYGKSTVKRYEEFLEMKPDE